jgi:hypothetical protein
MRPLSAQLRIVFVRAGDRWVQQAYLKAANPGIKRQFGSLVALSADGNTLAVSAPFEDSRAIGVDGDQAGQFDGAIRCGVRVCS